MLRWEAEGRIWVARSGGVLVAVVRPLTSGGDAWAWDVDPCDADGEAGTFDRAIAAAEAAWAEWCVNAGLAPVAGSPIHTAPREDGRRLLLFHEPTLEWVIGEWCSSRDAWLAAEDTRGDDPWLEPTHWASPPPHPDAESHWCGLVPPPKKGGDAGKGPS